jgi:hypothetical protein
VTPYEQLLLTVIPTNKTITVYAELEYESFQPATENLMEEKIK